MAKNMKISNEKEKMVVSEMGWGDLDSDLLRKIFGLLTPKELVPMTSVCQWWRSLCVDTLFWKNQESPQLSNLEFFIGQKANSEKLLQGLQLVMDANAAELRQQCVTKLKFPPKCNLYFEHLNFLAERTPKLKKFKTYCPLYSITTDITEAIQKWEDLEDLYVGPFHNSIIRKFIPAIGRSCKNLSVLSLDEDRGVSNYRFRLDEDNSLLIAKNLLQLKVFNLEDALIFKPGLQTILIECKLLVKLCFSKCYRVVDDWELSLRCLERSVSVKVEKVVADDCTGWSIIDSGEKMDTPEEVMNHIWSRRDKGDFWDWVCRRNNIDGEVTVKKIMFRRNGYTLVEWFP